MAQDSIDKVLASRQPASTAAAAEDGDKFYSVLVGEGVSEHFLELKFRTGMRTCFSYDDLIWFNYDPGRRIHGLGIWRLSGDSEGSRFWRYFLQPSEAKAGGLDRRGRC